MPLTVGESIVHLVTEDNEEVPRYVQSLSAGEACFPSLLPCVTTPVCLPAVLLKQRQEEAETWGASKGDQVQLSLTKLVF